MPMKPLTLPPHVKSAMDVVDQYKVDMTTKYKGKLITVPTGKYAGRTAQINAVSFRLSSWTGQPELLFLLYVWRKDGTGPLNTDGESRMYWHHQTIEEALETVSEAPHG